MLYVKRFVLISTAEEETGWLHRAKRQWGIERPLAARVKGRSEIVLGTTIPKEVAYKPDEKIWGIIWDGSMASPSSALDQSSEIQEGSISPAIIPGAAEHTVTNECRGHSDCGCDTDASVHNTPSFPPEPDKCQVERIGIDISEDMSDGILALEVINVLGEVQCVSIVNVSSALLSDSPQRFSTLLIPNRVKSVDDNTIYGILDIFVVGEVPRDKDPRKAVENYQNNSTATPSAYPVLKFSTETLYFPACFLTGTGTFIVSNVISVESSEDKTTSIELVVTGDTSVMKINPSQVTLHQKNERDFFVCTWNAFKPFTITGSVHDGGAVKLRALISVDGKSIPSVDIHLLNEPPRPTKINEGYLLWVNTTMITNVPCSQAERSLIEARLPVYTVLMKEAPPSSRMYHEIEN